MKFATHFLSVLAIIALFLFPVTIYATPNLLLNGDFEDGLNNWGYTGSVYTGLYDVPFFSPSGDGSSFVSLVSRSSTHSSTLFQTVDMTADENFRLSLDFTLATLEPGYGDDFRAEIWIDYIGGGPFTPLFSYYSGDGVFQDYDPVNFPGVRYFTKQGASYDFKWADADKDMVLRFLVIGYDDNNNSAMFLDNIKVYAVPEPGTISLLILGLSMAGAGFIRRKKS